MSKRKIRMTRKQAVNNVYAIAQEHGAMVGTIKQYVKMVEAFTEEVGVLQDGFYRDYCDEMQEATDAIKDALGVTDE
jgi:hypothetical protein